MSIALVDSAGLPLEHVGVSLGWDPAEVWVDVDGSVTADSRIDVNSAALVFSAEALVDTVYHEQLASRDGAITHSGDDPTGAGAGDNEVITVDLTLVAPQVTTVLFVATSYSGQSFARIENAYCRVLDTTSGVELTRYLLSGGQHTGLVIGKLVRAQQCWYYVGIGAGIYANHLADAVPQAVAYLR
ncbi:TerD family protein [Nocardia vulneris]|uniref:TerD family protein n=1 Tax=Nocardia vulneris TaxID=1141657 RepID=UPI0030D038EF